jgi:hypothetical protein
MNPVTAGLQDACEVAALIQDAALILEDNDLSQRQQEQHRS